MAQARWFQKLYYDESLEAIKLSCSFLTFESFKEHLPENLPQESLNSRKRISNNILKRFFSDKKLSNYLTKCWVEHDDDYLLNELMTVEFMHNEPVIAEFYIEHILGRQEGDEVDHNEFKKHIVKHYGKEIKNLEWWLIAALRDLFLIEKVEGKYIIIGTEPMEKAFLYSLQRFSDENCMIKIEEIYNADFCKYLGINDVEIIKKFISNLLLDKSLDLKDEYLLIPHK